MKLIILLGGMMLGLAAGTQASLTPSATYSPGVLVPDGTYSGLTETLTSSGTGTVGGLTVGLNLSGGYNGDLVAYLNYNDGTTSQTIYLLNRMGGGNSAASGSGFYNIILADGAGSNIHDAVPGSGNPVASGNYAPDSGVATFANTFKDMDVNGTWTLFFADLSTGGQSTLNGWSLDITAVPEPVNVALGCFAAMLLALAGLRWAWRT